MKFRNIQERKKNYALKLRSLLEFFKMDDQQQRDYAENRLHKEMEGKYG